MFARRIVLLLLPLVLLLLEPSCEGQTLSPRIVRTKQGSVKGVLVIPSNRDLQPVEAFLGIPFAAPPVGALRFMPPVSPLPWNGVRLMDKYGPACPQTLPDVSNEREALRFVTRGRLQYLRRLLPYLRNQSEDCLYLNIYAPVTVGGRDVNIKFPVIVFIHGESFEWNSGNPYDGSILASYGDVIVVTLNFRLGVLGFLRPDLKENRVANFGLLDQIAALQWIQENIEEFSGDRESVTLMGHGTGAVCVNLLLISPVAQTSGGLFQRAILMSGTALADWAVVENPLRYTLQAAQQVDCPLAERDDELAACLRFKRVTELMSVRLQAPLYASPLAPLVDGIVVPNEPRQSMKTYNDLFGRYDVMYGVTQSESFHLLNAATLQFGLTETERNRIIRTYVRNSYASNIDQVTAAILNEYTDWRNPVRGTEEYRDSILEILSDARVVAPVVQMADFHSAIRQRSYFYVFSHQTTNGDYPHIWGSIHGEELAYVFGMPLVGGTNHLSMNYTRAEMLLSEIVITYWSNFARTGDPNFPPRQKFLSVNVRDRFEPSYVQWPAYDRHSQKYLNIDLRPKVKDHYRADKMALWSKLIPELLSNNNGRITSSDDEEEESSMTHHHSTGTAGGVTPSNPPVMGAQPDPGGSSGFPLFPARPAAPSNSTAADEGAAEASGGLALSIIIVIGICFLVLNVCACAGVFYQRDRVRFKEMLLQRQYKLHPAGAGLPGTSGAAAGTESSEPDRERQLCRAAKAEEEDSADDMLQNDKLLPHQASTSTMDPHTKVSQWMAQEVIIEPCPLPGNHEREQFGGSGGNNNKSGRAGLLMGKLGGSDRYDPRESADGPMFPQLTKSSKAPDIYGLMVPLKEEGGSQQQEVALIEPVPRAGSAASASTTGTMSRRRKARSRSVSKRDVAVGDDEEENDGQQRESLMMASDPQTSSTYSTDTIRRLNLPKVLPDWPSEPGATDCEDGGGPQVRRPAYRDSLLKTPPSQTVVVAPHPRQSSNLSTTVSVPEPSLIVRPGVSRSPAPSSEHPPDVVVRRSSARPLSSSNGGGGGNRSSRSWYAQYSQSFMSQSIDEPSSVSGEATTTTELRET